MLAWIAGEQWKLENYRGFDRTGDPKLEPYCVTAAKILGRPVTAENENDRKTGKTADLACGYGGSVGAWRRFAPEDERSDADIQRDIASWRTAHPATVRFWRALEKGRRETQGTRARRAKQARPDRKVLLAPRVQPRQPAFTLSDRIAVAATARSPVPRANCSHL